MDAGLVEGVARYTVFERKVGAPSRSNLRAQLQISENLLHLLEDAAQVFGDFGGDHVGFGKVVGIEQAFVLEPEQIEADFVAGEQVF